MFFQHRMLYRSHLYGHRVSIYGDDGHVLFLGSVCRSRDDFIHLLSAAHHRNTLIFYKSDNISAVSAFEKLLRHLLPPLPENRIHTCTAV